MSDQPNFESRLTAALQRRADAAPIEVDAYAVTHAAATARPAMGARVFGVPAWTSARMVLAVVLLALLVVASLVIGSRLVSPAPDLPLGRLVPAGEMTTTRGGPTATLLQDGRVLLVAGQVGADDQSSAELYDPDTDSFTRTGPISTLWRMNPAAAALPDGRVLLVGGFGQTRDSEDVIPFSFAEIYDPTTGTFSRTGPMVQTRQSLWSAVTLPDGRVLIAGGEGDGSYDSVELFDPSTDTFVDGGSLLTPRSQYTMTLLRDGRVLITGGWSTDAPVATAEIYDPFTGTSVRTGDLRQARSGHTAEMLPDGRVLVVGGSGPGSSYGEALASAELYDPATGTFAPTGSLITERSGASSVTLPDGRVLVGGGHNVDGDPRTVELFDPASGTFDVVGSLAPAPSSGNSGWLSATLLDDGSVLLAGRDITTAERFVPTLPAEPVDTGAQVAPVGFVAVDGPGVLRTGHTATRLSDGRVLVVGGKVGGVGASLASAEIFDPATGRSGPTGSLAVPRSGHAAALLEDGRVLIMGGLRDADYAVSWPSAELYDPASGRFATAGVSTVAEVRSGGVISRDDSPDGDPAAATLEDGRVLIVGWDPDSTQGSGAVQVYDPATGAFTPIEAPRGRPTDAVARSVTLLADGRVLLITGAHFEPSIRAYVYDPATEDWAPAGGAVTGEAFSTTKLPDGRVMVAGGVAYHGADGTTAGVRIWDPDTATFTDTGALAAARAGHVATLLPDGRVLVTGGFFFAGDSEDPGAGAPIAPEAWDPRSGTFGPAGSMVAQRSGHTATLLEDGRVLIVGGVKRSPDRTDALPPFAELYVGS